MKMKSFAKLVLFALLALAPCASCSSFRQHLGQAAVKTLFEFPKGPKDGAWLRNMAIRPSGSILVTDMAHSNVYLFDPTASLVTPSLVTDFGNLDPPRNGTTGITETSYDTFQVVVGDYSDADFSGVSGSQLMYQIQFNSFDDKPSITQTADLSDIPLVNSLATLNSTHVLASDSSGGGAVWAINIETGAHSIVLEDPLFASDGSDDGSPMGINHMILQREANGPYLYFTNTEQSLLCKKFLGRDEFDKPVLKFEAVPFATTPGAEHDNGYSGFAIQGTNGYQWRSGWGLDFDIYLANSRGNTVSRVRVYGGDFKDKVIVAGHANSTQVVGPSAVAFGRTESDRHLLYVATAGGIGGDGSSDISLEADNSVGAQLLAIDTRTFM